MEERSLDQYYWNNNIPQEHWTIECPDFLKNLPLKSIEILCSRDDDFRRLTWPEVQCLIDINRIDLFQRFPTELRRYCEYVFRLKERYGSVMYFMQHQRLQWENTSPSTDTDFNHPCNYKVLYNDWPYAIDENITHLVVWTKTFIEEDEKSGDLTARARSMVEAFVLEMFCQEGGVDRQDLIWFKNWKSLKSVHALEHFHIMLYKASPRFLETVTQGDKPMRVIL